MIAAAKRSIAYCAVLLVLASCDGSSGNSTSSVDGDDPWVTTDNGAARGRFVLVDALDSWASVSSGALASIDNVLVDSSAAGVATVYFGGTTYDDTRTVIGTAVFRVDPRAGAYATPTLLFEDVGHFVFLGRYAGQLVFIAYNDEFRNPSILLVDEVTKARHTVVDPVDSGPNVVRGIQTVIVHPSGIYWNSVYYGESVAAAVGSSTPPSAATSERHDWTGRWTAATDKVEVTHDYIDDFVTDGTQILFPDVLDDSKPDTGYAMFAVTPGSDARRIANDGGGFEALKSWNAYRNELVGVAGDEVFIKTTNPNSYESSLYAVQVGGQESEHRGQRHVMDSPIAPKFVDSMPPSGQPSLHEAVVVAMDGDDVYWTSTSSAAREIVVADKRDGGKVKKQITLPRLITTSFGGLHNQTVAMDATNVYIATWPAAILVDPK